MNSPTVKVTACREKRHPFFFPAPYCFQRYLLRGIVWVIHGKRGTSEINKKREEARSFGTESFLSLQTNNCIVMITINLHHCNIFADTFRKNTVGMIQQYTTLTSTLNLLELECNYCHWKGSCVRHGHYERSYLLSAGDLEGTGKKIRILRVKCKHCKRTHAILPEENVPYLHFSTVFIQPILRQYYEKKKTVQAICEEFQIAVPQLYRWKNRFERQKDQFLGVLESARHNGREVLSWLLKLKDYGAEFAGRFLSETEKMPMQQHANPPNTRQPVFG